jgi:hypothetical protein
LKNPTEKILSAGFFYPLEKSLACGKAGFVFLQRINFKEPTLICSQAANQSFFKAA